MRPGPVRCAVRPEHAQGDHRASPPRRRHRTCHPCPGVAAPARGPAAATSRGIGRTVAAGFAEPGERGMAEEAPAGRGTAERVLDIALATRSRSSARRGGLRRFRRRPAARHLLGRRDRPGATAVREEAMSSDRSRAGPRCPTPPASLVGHGKTETPHRTARKPVPAFLRRTGRTAPPGTRSAPAWSPFPAPPRERGPCEAVPIRSEAIPILTVSIGRPGRGEVLQLGL